MREVRGVNVLGQAVLWSFWLGLALAVSGCGEGGGSPTAPKGSTAQSSRAVAPVQPSITGVFRSGTNVTSAPGATFIDIFGTNFGTTQFFDASQTPPIPRSEVLFLRNTGEILNAGFVTNLSDWSNTRIRILLLGSLSNEVVRVKVQLHGGIAAGGQASSEFPFTVEATLPPTITAVQPRGAVAGQQVAITGSDFGDAQLGTSTVLFTGANGAVVAAGTALSWTNTRIVVNLPVGAQSGPVIVSKGTQQSTVSPSTPNLVVSDIIPPSLASSSPSKNVTGVDPRAPIVLVYTESMNDGAALGSNYILTASNGASRAVRAERLSPTTVRLSFDPLDGGVRWTLSATSGITDLANNPLTSLDLSFVTANIPGIRGSDHTAPTLLATTPANGAVNVNINTSLKLDFSEPVTLTAASIAITSDGGNSVPQSSILVSPNTTAANYVITLPPLVGGNTYTVRLDSSIKDLADNVFAGTTFRFLTQEVQGVRGSDKTPPTLVSSNPTTNSTGVSPNTQILLIFSEPISPTNNSSMAANFRLTTNGGTDNTAISASVNGSSVVLTLAGALLVDHIYSLFLSSNIQDQAGNALAPTNPITFRTLNIPGEPGDTTPPRIVTFSPADGDRNVSTSGDLIYTFSEVMDPARLTDTTCYVLTSQDGTADLTPTAIGKSAVRLTPKHVLTDNRDYTLLFTSLLADKAHNTLTPVSITFHTADIPGDPGDKTPPTLLSSTPRTGATSVDNNSPLVLVFSEPITNASDRNRYTLQPSGFQAITPTSATPSGSQVVLDFGTLRVDTDYSLRLNGLLDRNNNALVPTQPITFHTVNIPGEFGDHTPPRVVSSSPTEAQVVGVDTEIFITFSERIKPETLSSANIRLTTDGGRLDINVSPVGSTSVAISATSGKLLSNTPFQLFLSTAIQDLASNPLIPFTLGFRTANVIGVPGADVTPPVLVSSTPANGSQRFDPFSNLLLVFSEPMSITEAKNIGNYHLRVVGTSTDVSMTAPTVFRNFVSLIPATITPDVPPLLVATNYSLSIEPGKLRDSAGNLLPPTSPIFFSTADIPGFPGDKTPPTVLSVNPSGPTSVSTNTDIFVSFSELMDVSSFSKDNVILTTSGGPFPIVTITTFAGSSALMKIEPGQISPSKPFKLLPGLQYNLSLSGGLRDKVGNPCVPFASFFVSLAQSSTGGRDVTPPVLVFSNPADGSTNVDPHTHFLMTFSKDLTPTAINKSNFTITSDVGSFIPTQPASIVNSPPHSLLLDPGKLLGNTKYTVVLSNSITDLAGNALRPTAFAFTTAQVSGTDQDRTPPTVLSTNPPNGSAAVAKDSVITVTFSKLVNFTPVAPNALTSTAAASSALNPLNYQLFSSFDNPGIVTATVLPFPPNSIQLTPAAFLRGGTQYNLIASSRILDLAKNSLVSTLVSFTTVDQPGTGTGDSTPPRVTATNPPNGQQVTNSLTNIEITFSEPMNDTSTVADTSVTNIGNYIIRTACSVGGLSSSASGPTIQKIQELTVPANSVRIALSNSVPDPLTPTNAVYYVELSNRMTDRAGNPLSPFSFTFTQGAPPSPPKVIVTSVDIGTVSTSTNTIDVTFDRDVIDTTPLNPTDNFIVSGVAKNAADSPDFNTNYDIDIDTVTATIPNRKFKVTLKRSGVASPDTNFRLKKTSGFTLVVLGFQSVDPCGTQDQQSFSKVFATP